MKTTTNYGLKKPEASDYATPDAFNENADTIDLALHNLETGKAGAINGNGALSGAIADADYLPLYDTSAAAEKKTLWSTIKSTLKTYFDTLYAAASALTSHTGNTSNPHSVTASQVGLGNVPNVATNNQTPSYTAASTLTALASGEVLSTAFGKIAKAISSLISHLGNVSNPHAVTAAQVGADPTGTAVSAAASAVSAHNATSDAHSALFAEVDSKLGDVIFTNRSSLGSKWLLCNGALIDSTTYPDLYNITRGLGCDTLSQISSALALYYISDITYANGYYVCCGYDTSYISYVFWATSLSGPWASVTMPQTAVVRQVSYGNGYWACCGSSNATSMGGYVFYATIPNGTWTAVNVTGAVSPYFRGIIYANGYWIVPAVSSTKNYIYYATSPAGTWTSKQVGTTTSTFNRFSYVNGAYVMLFGTQNGYASIIYATDLLGTWTPVIISQANYYYPVDIVFYNNKWTILASGNSGSGLYILQSDTLSNTSWSIYSVSTSGTQYARLFILNNILVAISTYLFFTDDVSNGVWTTIKLPTATTVQYSGIFILGDYVYATLIGTSSYPYYVKIGRAVPLLSLGSAYIYIKALV